MTFIPYHPGYPVTVKFEYVYTKTEKSFLGRTKTRYFAAAYIPHQQHIDGPPPRYDPLAIDDDSWIFDRNREIEITKRFYDEIIARAKKVREVTGR